MIQSQNDFTQCIDRLEARMSQLINNYRKEKTLPYQYLTNPDISNPIDLVQESCCFRNQDSISAYPLELDQYSTFDKLASYHFNKIELEHDCDPVFNFVIQFQILNLY